MDTVGSLIDKMSIAEKRISVTADASVVYEIKQQLGWMLLEIAHNIIDGYSGSRPLMFKKHKVYDKDVKSFENMGVTGLLPLIQTLKEHNNKLWELEDTRRNKSLSDEERLAAADEVSVYNKKRNDTIDLIDENINSWISSIK